MTLSPPADRKHLKYMYPLFLDKLSSYEDKEAVKCFVNKFLPAAGKTGFHGKKVLIKPNFLKPSAPEKAIITNPLFLTPLMELFSDLGGKLFIGDSPGLGTISAVINKAGLGEDIKRLNVVVADFSRTGAFKCPNPTLFREFTLPEILFEVDEIVNVPKLKTHQMMLLSLAVKNLYGCIYGPEKIKYHLTAGENHDRFATLLFDLYKLIKPGINILDGIDGMEGDGPASGDVKRFGLIAACEDALTLDAGIAGLFGIKKDAFPLMKIVSRHSTGEADISQTSFASGSDHEPYRMQIKLPRSYGADFNIPGVLKGFVKNFFLAYPYVTKNCTACGVCRGHCPVSAIEIKKIARINRKKCIRCYCCQELCEHNAIKINRGFFRPI